MAKKSEVIPNDLFKKSGSTARTATKAKADNNDLDTGRISPVGTGLKEGEKQALKAIAAQHDLTLNALMRYALRRFIVDVRIGKIDLAAEEATPEPAKKKLKLPR